MHKNMPYVFPHWWTVGHQWCEHRLLQGYHCSVVWSCWNAMLTVWYWWLWHHYMVMVIDTDWVSFWWVSAEWHNSSVLAMELCLSCTNLSIYMDIWSIYCLTLTSCISRKVMIVLLWKKSSCVILLFIVLANKWLFPSVSYNYQWPLLLTWFNFNPSMDK